MVTQEIRTFNELSSLVEKLNKVYSWIILTSVFTGIIHLSIHIFTLFKDDAGISDKFGVLLTIVGFSAELWALAMVHHEAKLIGRTLQSRFDIPVEENLNERDAFKRLETQNALILLVQDLNVGNVGIKGHEFFTCTPGFIGTVSDSSLDGILIYKSLQCFVC